MEVMAMIVAIGMAVCELNKLTPTEASAPMPIWMAPISAEALPALRVKEASDRAEVLGLVKPRQPRKKPAREPFSRG